jgi:uncharacterized protein YqeY
MTILEQLKKSTIVSMKAKDSKKLKVLRTINAKIKQYQIDNKVDMNDVECLAVLNKILKQHQESISIFKDAGRDELANEENYQVTILQDFLPKPLNESQIEEIIQDAFTTFEPVSKNMGMIVKFIQEKVAGRANMGKIVPVIKSKLK